MKKFTLSFIMALLMAPLAFAGTDPVEMMPVADLEPVMATVSVDGEVMEGMEDKMIWPPSYPNSSVWINAQTTTSVYVEDVVVAGNYYVSQVSTRTEAEEKLARMAQDAKRKFQSFGKVEVQGPWVYPTWDYTTQTESKNAFEGSVYVRVMMSSPSELESVKAMFQADGYRDVFVETDYTKQWLKEEGEAIPALKAMMDQKKANYEMLLGNTLTQVLSANLWSWVDMNTYNAETGMATLTVSADMSYMIPMNITLDIKETEWVPAMTFEMSF